ncbi:hypothetical protein [Sunxiuqinia sp. sy24]|uniref:hypothetical protein n=1 Tax=Sunxiuqinia sp. sy24 TaxID=3461495 RepID=UPI0040460339
MKKVKIILLFALALTAFSCQNKVGLETDNLLTETFNENEIKGLELMVEYVDKMVLEKTNETNINNAYHLFFEKMSNVIKDSSKFLIPFRANAKYEYLEKMDTTVFNAIWHMSTHTRMVRYQDTIYRDLENFKNLKLKPVGDYMNYLEKLGENDDFFKSLHENINISGDLPTGTAVYFPRNHDKFDFNIPKNRLWAAIYILRIEEPFEMKMKRYLNR